MYISLEYCFYFLLATLCLILLVLMVLIFVNINKVLKSVNELVNQNKDNITNTLNEVPGLVKNVNELVICSKNITENVEETVENISCFVEEKTSLYGGIIGSILKVILDFFPKSKK